MQRGPPREPLRTPTTAARHKERELAGLVRNGRIFRPWSPDLPGFPLGSARFARRQRWRQRRWGERWWEGSHDRIVNHTIPGGYSICPTTRTAGV